MNVLTDILYPAIAEAKESIPTADKLEPKADCRLYGNGLDSMGLVQLIVMVEERIEDQTKIALTLASDKAMSRRASPFSTVQTLADYITECLTEVGYRA